MQRNFFVKPITGVDGILHSPYNDTCAAVVELAYTADLKSAGETLGVRVPPAAPNQYNPNLFPTEDGFGLFVFFDRYETIYFPQRGKTQTRFKIKRAWTEETVAITQEYL